MKDEGEFSKDCDLPPELPMGSFERLSLASTKDFIEVIIIKDFHRIEINSKF